VPECPYSRRPAAEPNESEETRAGCARRLYEAFAGLVAARGCTAIKAITAPTNLGSIAFHESLGMGHHRHPDRPVVVEVGLVLRHAVEQEHTPSLLDR